MGPDHLDAAPVRRGSGLHSSGHGFVLENGDLASFTNWRREMLAFLTLPSFN
jgi:hypothetical protein